MFNTASSQSLHNTETPNIYQADFSHTEKSAIFHFPAAKLQVQVLGKCNGNSSRSVRMRESAEKGVQNGVWVGKAKSQTKKGESQARASSCTRIQARAKRQGHTHSGKARCVYGAGWVGGGWPSRRGWRPRVRSMCVSICE